MTTESQLLISRLKPIVFGGIPSLLIAGWAAFYPEAFVGHGWLILVIPLTLLAIASNRNLRRWQNMRAYLLTDSPSPSLVNLLQLGIMPLFTATLICVASYLLVLILSIWGVASQANWLYGPIVIFIWLFAYRIINSFYTLYLVDREAIIIVHGLDRVVVPFSKITEALLEQNVKTNLPKLMLTGYSYIPGVRNYNFLVLKLRLTDLIISLWYPEIYLTPTNPTEFRRILQEARLKS